MNNPIFFTSFFSMKRSGSNCLTSAAKVTGKPVGSKCVIVAAPLLPASRFCHVSSVPTPSALTKPTPVTTTLRAKFCPPVDLRRQFFAGLAWAWMYSTASFTVWIFSASSSGISISNASSNAITNSTMSSESAPRSSTKCAVGVTSASSTPSCSTIICLTFSSGEAIDVSSSPYMGLAILTLGSRGVKLPSSRLSQQRAARQAKTPRYCYENVFPLIWPEPSSGHVHTAIDVQHVTCDVTCFLRCEEANAAGNIYVSTHSARRNDAQQLLADLFGQFVCHRRCDKARSDGVYGDPPSRNFRSHGLGEPD